jgi:S-sulfo-L-cysteine synthase (3-phospho-L-serine-dependent)
VNGRPQAAGPDADGQGSGGDQWLVLVESNTTGSGRLFCACARRVGLRPVLFARDPGRYPYVQADGIDTRVVDTAQPDAIRAACALLPGRIAGVASSSEYFIATAGEIARWLGLPHPDPAAVRACRDKQAQRARLLEAGVPGPAFAAARTPEDAAAAAARIGYPVVVKPVAGSGSIGTRLCTHEGEVRAAASYVLDTDPAALALPPQSAVMVEEYLDGCEYSVETLGTQVIGITRKHLGPAPFFVETGHDFPAPLAAADQAAIGTTAIGALRALGLGWGAAHVELRHTAAGPRIVEVNPRLAGGMIPRMVEEAAGIDMISHVVAWAVGRAELARPTRARAASIRFLVAPAAGHVAGIRGLRQARALPGVVEVGLTGQPGQEVALTHSFRDRLGYVIAAADDGNVAARRADDALLTLEARIVPASCLAAEGAVG